MKILRLTLVVLLAVIGYVALPQAPAEAEHLRWMTPGYFPPPPSRRVYRYYPEPYEDEIYDDDFYGDDYDDEVYYYEPEPLYEPKPRKRKKKSTASAPVKVKPQTAEKPKNEKAKKKPAQTASAPKPKKTTAKTTAKTTVSANVSCDKAKSIVTGYGFSDIQTTSCSGSVYSFAANRGGKTFAVKVSALNGELTEVKRQ